MTKKQAEIIEFIQEYVKHNDPSWFEGWRADEVYELIKQENEVET